MTLHDVTIAVVMMCADTFCYCFQGCAQFDLDVRTIDTHSHL